ncbi:hypothetical protein E4U38_002852 [Claviceps purpurea]|nr:hypothetical protein E4U38_002852 [Claviceps purpurea]KAG6251302.1 hypothetical protein E4U23_000789 [Claviceps purpurea]
MIVNCKEILVLPSTTQWNGVVSRLDIVAGKLDSLHEGVNTRLDTMTTRLNSMESNMNTRFDRLDTQLMMVITQLTETNARLAGVGQRLANSDIKFEALFSTSRGDRLEPLYSVRTGRKIRAVQFRRDLEHLLRQERKDLVN